MMKKKMIEGEDLYFNKDGLMVFTAKYLTERGYCCKTGCTHCPYGYKKTTKNREIITSHKK